MKHASEQVLLSISPLLDQLRAIPKIKEKKLGIFYYKSKAFLHFHEEGENLFADVRLDGVEFKRLPSTTKTEQSVLVNLIKKALE